MNRVILIGRVTRDVELRKTNTGTSVASFTVAVNRRVAQGQEPQADFINCTAWNKTAELMGQYVKKGSQIGVEGRIQTRNYEKDGQRVFVTEVVADSVQFLESRSSSAQRSESPVVNNSYQADQQFDDSFSLDSFDPSSEDLPF